MFLRPALEASVEGAMVKIGTDWQKLNHRQQRYVAVRFYRNIARIGLAMSVFWLDLSKYLRRSGRRYTALKSTNQKPLFSNFGLASRNPAVLRREVYSSGGERVPGRAEGEPVS
jgi:hypothetical protein